MDVEAVLHELAEQYFDHSSYAAELFLNEDRTRDLIARMPPDLRKGGNVDQQVAYLGAAARESAQKARRAYANKLAREASGATTRGIAVAWESAGSDMDAVRATQLAISDALRRARLVQLGEMPAEALFADSQAMEEKLTEYELRKWKRLQELGEAPMDEPYPPSMHRRTGPRSVSQADMHRQQRLRELGELPPEENEPTPSKPVAGKPSAMPKRVLRRMRPASSPMDLTENAMPMGMPVSAAAAPFAATTQAQQATYSEQKDGALSRSFARGTNAAAAFDRDLNQLMDEHGVTNAEQRAAIMRHMRTQPTLGGWATVKKLGKKAIQKITGKSKSKDKEKDKDREKEADKKHAEAKATYHANHKTGSQSAEFGTSTAATTALAAKLRNLSLAPTASSAAQTAHTDGFVSKFKTLVGLTGDNAHVNLAAQEMSEGMGALDYAEAVCVGETAFAKHALGMLYHLIVEKGLAPETIQSQLVTNWTRQNVAKPWNGELEKIQLGMAIQSSKITGNLQEASSVVSFSYVRGDWKVGESSSGEKSGLAMFVSSTPIPWTAFFKGLKLGDPPVWSRLQDVKIPIANGIGKEKLAMGKFPLSAGLNLTLHLQESPPLTEAITAGHRSLLFATNPIALTDVNGMEQKILFVMPLLDSRTRVIFAILQ